MNKFLLPLAFLFAFCGTTKKVEEPITIKKDMLIRAF